MEWYYKINNVTARKIMADTGSDPSKNTDTQTERSKVNTVWISIAVVVIILALFVTFVAQNAQAVTVHFLWLNGTISLALALIIATLVGAIITFTVGSIRIWQLSHKNKSTDKPKDK